MVTARRLTNCSNTLRNIHTNAREDITRTRVKRWAGYFSVAHPLFEYTQKTGSRYFHSVSAMCVKNGFTDCGLNTNIRLWGGEINIQTSY
jgi:hypothetical protein